MAGFPSGLVWLASYPKSGNTWMRVLLANLLSDGDAPADINFLSGEVSPVGRWRFDDDMLADAGLLSGPELERLRPLHGDHVAANLKTAFFCKTHDRFHGEAGRPVLGSKARAALYLVRDPRDVAISLSHHLGSSIDHAITLMLDRTCHSTSDLQVRQVLGDWAGHVTGWTEQLAVPTQVVHYEVLHRDPVATLKALIVFLEGTATDSEIDRAVALSTLERLQQQETAHGFRERLPGQARFFRSGRVGEWREVLTPSQVKRIEERFLPVMAGLGYHPA